jgi:hypothetical protein
LATGEERRVKAKSGRPSEEAIVSTAGWQTREERRVKAKSGRPSEEAIVSTAGWQTRR